MPKPVGHFIDPVKQQRIDVYPRKGETAQQAINRVASNHGVPTSKVIKHETKRS